MRDLWLVRPRATGLRGPPCLAQGARLARAATLAHGPRLRPGRSAPFAARQWTHARQVAWLGAIFDYFERHPQVKAVSCFYDKVKPDCSFDSPGHVHLCGGRVDDAPNANDDDQRLVSGSAGIRGLFARRIADPRHISTLVIGK